MFAIPAVNVVSSTSCNAVMEAAAKIGSPIIIQASKFHMFAPSHLLSGLERT